MTQGRLAEAEEDTRVSLSFYDRLGFTKMQWRARLHLAHVLYELGRIEEADRTLPPASSRTEVQDAIYDGPARIRIALAAGRIDEAVEQAREITAVANFRSYRETFGIAAEAFAAAGMVEEAAAAIEASRAHRSTSGGAFLDLAEAKLALATGDHERALQRARASAEAADAADFPLMALRARIIEASALALLGEGIAAAGTFHAVSERAAASGAHAILDENIAGAARVGITTAPPDPAAAAPEPTTVAVGERLVTSMFADVRGYTEMTAATAPAEMADRIATMYRWARDEVERRYGVVNKFAGDAVMATFNVSGAQLDHCVQALESALALRDKAWLADLPLGIGIAVGPAVVGTVVAGQDMMVTGVATNMAARLQTHAGAGEIVLSDEAYRRVERWLGERGIEATRDEVELKGFDGPQVAYRVRAAAAVTG